MNTNHSQSNLKDFTKSAAYHLSDDVLAVHLQLFVESVARVLVWVYVAGLLTGEVGRTLVQPYVTRMGDLFTYKTTQMGDLKAAVLADTVKEEVLN